MVIRKRNIYILSAFMVLGLFAIPGSVSAIENDHRPATTAAEDRREKIEQRKQEFREKVIARQEERVAKLETKRLEACEKKEAKINRIIDKSVEQSNKHLAVFQKIEERVKTFYQSKNLNAINYEALLKEADDKETAAIAAISLAGETTFECETADGSKPGEKVRELVRTQHAALKAYRTAIKDLIVGIKSSNSKNSSDDTTDRTRTDDNSDSNTETEAETQTETETSSETEGSQQ